MDTRRPSEPRSLFGEILDWMLAPLLLLWPMSVALTWFVAQGIANRPYDRDLADLLQALARQVHVQEPAPASRRAGVVVDVSEAASLLLQSDNDGEQVFYQVLGARGEYLAGDFDLPVPDEGVVPSDEVRFRDETVHGLPVRVAYRWLPGPRGTAPWASLVQVATTLDKRSQLATEIVKGVILPQFIILPVAVVLVWFALSRGIRPLAELQRRIRQRQSTDLSPIPEREVPDEVVPLVKAINDLLARLDRSLATQKHFLADAAHQLKTPLAGLRMQAELAERQIDHGVADAHDLKPSLQQIARSSQRAAHMVNQLLAMARAEDQEHAAPRVRCNLAALTRDTVQDFVPQALERGIDLGYEGPDRPDAATLTGEPVLLVELVRNLLDNALRYCGHGGSVTARVMSDPFGQVVVLQVEDDGPGIAPAERDKVFQPFYRTLGTEVDGSGLGLSIVREIAQRHGAEIVVEETQAPGRAMPAGREGRGPGARFTMRFPRHRRPTPVDEAGAGSSQAPLAP